MKKKLLLVWMKGQEKKQLAATIRQLTQWFSVDTKERDQIKEKISGYAFVASYGGDGTFLKAARFIASPIPLFGINSDPKHKEGFYAPVTLQTLQQACLALQTNRYKVLPLLRLQAIIDGKPLPYLALNECFVGNKESYLSAHYEIQYKRLRAKQKDSGIIIATPSGSWGWYASAGGTPIPLQSKYAVFLCREPYCGKTIACKIVQGILQRKERLTIVSHMPKGIVSLDSAMVFPLPKGKKATIRLAKTPLLMIQFPFFQKTYGLQKKEMRKKYEKK
ncbi:MAG: hypothetical protein QW594_00395 [Candidatus Woesearchaeota archaeon]